MANYIHGINSNTYDLLFDDNSTRDYIDNFTSEDDLLYFIEHLTLLSNSEIHKITFLNPFVRIKRGLLKKDVFEKNIIYIKHNGIKYKFILLDNVIPNIDYAYNLRSESRYGKCMTLAIHLGLSAASSKEKINILTGYINEYGSEYIHTVIEYCRNGKSYIMDATKNLIMEKDNYFSLTNFKLISEIDNFTMEDDFKKIKGMNLYTKPYFVFRDEIMNDINKIKTLK